MHTVRPDCRADGVELLLGEIPGLIVVRIFAPSVKPFENPGLDNLPRYEGKEVMDV